MSLWTEHAQPVRGEEVMHTLVFKLFHTCTQICACMSAEDMQREPLKPNFHPDFRANDLCMQLCACKSAEDMKTEQLKLHFHPDFRATDL